MLDIEKLTKYWEAFTMTLGEYPEEWLISERRSAEEVYMLFMRWYSNNEGLF